MFPCRFLSVVSGCQGVTMQKLRCCKGFRHVSMQFLKCCEWLPGCCYAEVKVL